MWTSNSRSTMIRNRRKPKNCYLASTLRLSCHHHHLWLFSLSSAHYKKNTVILSPTDSSVLCTLRPSICHLSSFFYFSSPNGFKTIKIWKWTKSNIFNTKPHKPCSSLKAINNCSLFLPAFFLVFSICRTSWFFCIFYVEYFFTKKLKDDLCGLALIFVYFVFLSQVLYLASGKPSPETFYFSSGLWQDKRILTSIQLP